MSSLELLLKNNSYNTDTDMYLKLFNKIITSNNIVSFETFNHPIGQIFIIDYSLDTLDSLRKMIVEFRNNTFPPYFQLDDLLIHVLVIYNSELVGDADVINFQNLIKKNLSINSTSIPIIENAAHFNDEAEFVTVFKNENSTIDEDLQLLSLNQSKKLLDFNSGSFLKIPKSIDIALRNKIYEFINKFLIPHMERKIRVWDDQILSPKKSFTGRIFSVSKKLFNNNDSSSSPSPSSTTFNFLDNYYHKSSTEQIIRKLADWSLILKDFKYAYSAYDLIKKDYTNDKAWLYVASTQEMCIVSLLLAQTQQISNLPQPPDKNTLRKIRHDIIEPYIDNLCYTFKSRLNVKTYSIKSLLIVVELLLCMCITFNITWWWNDLIEKYITKCINEFDSHLISTNQKLQAIRAILYERLGYSFGKCIYLTDFNQDLFNPEVKTEKPELEEGMYVNTNKLHPDSNNAIKGLTRFRKSAIWYLLSIREWLELKNFNQIALLLHNIKFIYKTDDLTGNWYDRSDLLLGFVKKSLLEFESNDTTISTETEKQ